MAWSIRILLGNFCQSKCWKQFHHGNISQVCFGPLISLVNGHIGGMNLSFDMKRKGRNQQILVYFVLVSIDDEFL